MTKALLTAISLALMLAACAAPNETTGSDADVPEHLQSPVDIAMADLASRIGSDATIVVVASEDVMWPDGSLGCPQPGMSYTQAIVDGYLIELSDGTTSYPYHGAVGRDPFLCESADELSSKGSGDVAPSETLPTVAPNNDGEASVADQPPATEPGDTDPSLASLVASSSADLVKRLSVPLGDIVVVSAESVVWPDGSLGCPIPDMRYTQVQIEGAKIVLAVDGGLYTYHSGANRDPFLCVPTKAAPGTTGLTLPGTTNADE